MEKRKLPLMKEPSKQTSKQASTRVYVEIRVVTWLKNPLRKRKSNVALESFAFIQKFKTDFYPSNSELLEKLIKIKVSILLIINSQHMVSLFVYHCCFIYLFSRNL
ncbi:CLUMA_CG011636, isoform A [Clunio marinus]|uniref:CLUMA_CG011636, isoform A n=1 Tax=Clunio marinus TaxID=568069 RepID=A0A1J1IET2_9DIPT|nr:CLUMA_CG011636, isoform A [Clunio marinus]